MKADRRAFLGMLASSLALLVGRPAIARAQRRAVEIHQATRNTLRALGARLPRLKRPPLPFKTYPKAERLALPLAAEAPGPALSEVLSAYARVGGFRGAAISLAELGRLLYLTNGVTARRRDLHLRAAPSAGALYSGEVYVVAERVRELAPGVYYYAVLDHELVRVRAGSFGAEVERALERPAEIAGAAAVICLTNVFQRYTWRYANRGYRYALIDSGHIGENLRLAATGAGLGEIGPLRFHDDRLNALLQVDGREEAVCAFHALGVPSDGSPNRATPTRAFAEKQSAEQAPSRGRDIERYHAATKLVEVGARAPPPIAPAPPRLVSQSSVALARKSPPPTKTLESTIRARRSAMQFCREPISLEDLGFVLEAAQGHAALERAPVDLYVAVHRVSGLRPALYRYEAGRHRLAPTREGDLTEPMVRACLGQKKAGSAAVGLLMAGQLKREAARAGERSYRDLLLESGAIGQRIYLAAEAVDLSARNLAAFADDELNRLLGLDGRNEAVIHLTMLGRGE